MTEGFDLGLASSHSLVRRGYSYLVRNVGKTVAVITLLVTALVSFTEISFSSLGTEGFTSTLVMMLLASYVMYFSLEDAGERLGREGDEYRAVRERHQALQREIKGCDVGRLREFCLDYGSRELEYRRDNLLFTLGYTKEEYEAYLSGADLPKKMQNALYRVKKLKRTELNATMLLSGDGKTKSELKSPEASRIYNMLARLVPSTVCMLFTVSVMISVKDNLTAAGVIEAILKLSTLPVIGLKGYAGGYEYVINSECAWLETKCRLLEAFLKEKAEE